jgi:hypothetical protein
MILIDAKIDCLTVNRIKYTFVNMPENEIDGWKQLLQSLDGYKFEIHQTQNICNQHHWCYLPNTETTIYVHDEDKYSIEYYLKNGESCDWEIGNLNALMSFLSVYPNHPACE